MTADGAPDPAPEPKGTRPLRREDLDAVARLRRASFERSHHETHADLRAYMEWLFFESPWADPDLPSRVVRGDDGELLGFLGVLGHSVRFRGRRLRAAVTTQHMTGRTAGPLTAIRLSREVLRGPQDLTYTNNATQEARRLWLGSGGQVLTWQSHRWLRPLRPFRWWTGKIGEGTAARPVRFLLRPACAALDRLWRRWGRDAFERAPEGRRLPLTPERAVRTTASLAREGCLWPDPEGDELEVILDELGQEEHGRAAAGSVVRGRDDEPLGWYVYHSNPGGECRVPAIVAAPEGAGRVLAHLFAETYADGAVVVSGQVVPLHSDALAGCGALLRRAGSWTLAHSRHEDISRALSDGRAALTELDGEGWFRF